MSSSTFGVKGSLNGDFQIMVLILPWNRLDKKTETGQSPVSEVERIQSAEVVQDRLAEIGRRRKDKFMHRKQNNLAHMNTPYSKSWKGLEMLNFNISPYNNCICGLKAKSISLHLHRRWESITAGGQHSSWNNSTLYGSSPTWPERESKYTVITHSVHLLFWFLKKKLDTRN